MSRNQFESLFFSIDFAASIIVAVLVFFLVPDKIKLTIAKDVFETAIAVTSIIFSIYFAALAIIITSGDNKFIDFLEEEGAYTHIIWTFKVTLLLLFLSLIASIVLYVLILPYSDLDIGKKWLPNWGMALYSFISSWSLFAAALSILDSIKYAEYRLRFIVLTHDDDSK